MPHDEYSHVKVSVITVVYNAVDVIESTVKSVLSQSYEDVEYVVIDGGSTDGTVEILNRYRDRISYLVSEKDGGIYDAMNKGIDVATGDWIGVMNAGDVFTSDDVLSKIFHAGERYDGVDVLYGDAISVSGEHRVISVAPEEAHGLARNPVYRHGASFVRRATHKRYMFDLRLKDRLQFALDFEQIHRMYVGGCVFCKVPVTVVDFARRGASTCSPFKPGYYNYLISHGMRCSCAMRLWLAWEACWLKILSLLKRGRTSPLALT